MELFTYLKKLQKDLLDNFVDEKLNIFICAEYHMFFQTPKFRLIQKFKNMHIK